VKRRIEWTGIVSVKSLTPVPTRIIKTKKEDRGGKGGERIRELGRRKRKGETHICAHGVDASAKRGKDYESGGRGDLHMLDSG